MKFLFAGLFRKRGSRFAKIVHPSGLQPGLWASPSDAASPAPPLPAAPLRGNNPFAAGTAGESRRPTFVPGRAAAPLRWWKRFRAWLGWPEASATRRRLFPTSNQLELVLGRSNAPARNRNLEIGLSARVRRSGASADKTKVIYESKPVVAAEAARMMEESDRAYTRLRGRRLESLRVAND